MHNSLEVLPKTRKVCMMIPQCLMVPCPACRTLGCWCASADWLGWNKSPGLSLLHLPSGTAGFHFRVPGATSKFVESQVISCSACWNMQGVATGGAVHVNACLCHLQHAAAVHFLA